MGLRAAGTLIATGDLATATTATAGTPQVRFTFDPGTASHVQAQRRAMRHASATMGGYKWSEEDGKCVEDPNESELALAIKNNHTQERIAELMEQMEDSNRAVMYNVLIAAMWAFAASFVTIGGVIVLLRSRSRAAKVENTEYGVLEG